MTDVVEVEGCGGPAFERLHIETVLDGGNLRLDGPAGMLQQVAASEVERLLIHPHQRGGEALGRDGRRLGRDDQVTSANVQFICKGKGHRLGSLGNWKVAIEGDDAADAAGSA